MKILEVNPNNEKYYTKDFISGYRCGTKRQFESDLTILDNIRTEIIDEKDFAYADFNQYKIEYLGADAEYVEDELPQDDFRYGMERAIDLIDKYRK